MYLVGCLHACQSRVTVGDVSLVELLYLVFTRMPGASYRWRLRSLLLCQCVSVCGVFFDRYLTPLLVDSNELE